MYRKHKFSILKTSSKKESSFEGGAQRAEDEDRFRVAGLLINKCRYTNLYVLGKFKFRLAKILMYYKTFNLIYISMTIHPLPSASPSRENFKKASCKFQFSSKVVKKVLEVRKYGREIII